MIEWIIPSTIALILIVAFSYGQGKVDGYLAAREVERKKRQIETRRSGR